MSNSISAALRADCLASLDSLPGLPSQLKGQRIAVVGGTGFVGAWLAECVAALNDDFGCRVRLDLLGTRATGWAAAHSHLARTGQIEAHAADARSAVSLPRDTSLVVFAAGLADPRVHASDPARVFQTIVHGIEHTLASAARLERLQRVVNISSGLALGAAATQEALTETDFGAFDFTRFHNVYAEARRASESIAAVHAGQYRLPISTARAFTFLGPYQPLDAPWAINNFIRDALSGNDIRIHGDGQTRRSYLYGSDVAAWLLKLLVDGQDGQVCNLGGSEPVSHAEAAAMVAECVAPRPSLSYKSLPHATGRTHDFYPDVRHTAAVLGVSPTFGPEAAVQRSVRWHAERSGAARKLSPSVADR